MDSASDKNVTNPIMKEGWFWSIPAADYLGTTAGVGQPTTLANLVTVEMTNRNWISKKWRKPTILSKQNKKNLVISRYIAEP